jgi:hypothetical protein
MLIGQNTIFLSRKYLIQRLTQQAGFARPPPPGGRTSGDSAALRAAIEAIRQSPS